MASYLSLNPLDFLFKVIIGTKLSLYGSLSNDSTSGNTAAYQVDDNPPVAFALWGPASPISIGHNQDLFNTPPLNPGEHTVIVAFNGSSIGPPLTISYFYVTSLTTSEQESLGTPNVTSASTRQAPTPTQTQMINTHSSAHTHTIIGVVLGIMLPVLLLAALAILWYRRKLKHQTDWVPTAYSDLITTPFNPEDLTIVPEKVLTSSITPVVNSGESNQLDDCFHHSCYSFWDDIVDSHSLQNNVDMNRTNLAMNALTIKLQQRLVIMESERARQREQHAADSTTSQQQLMVPGSVVHTDSGLRLNGEVRQVDRQMEEVPPGYTAD